MIQDAAMENHSPAATEREQLPRPLRTAYIMSRFPKLTETFVLFEIIAVKRLGVGVDIYPLLRERQSVVHKEALPLVADAHYLPFVSLPIILAQFRAVFRNPAAYFSTLWAVVRAAWGNWNYLFGGLAIYPKCVFMAEQMRKQGIEHVHAHFANHPTTAALVIRRLAGIPYSFTAHGTDLHRDQHMLRDKVEQARFVVTISDHNKRLIDEVCGKRSSGKVIVIHCGVDTKVFYPAKRQPADIPFRFVCTGSLLEVKGHRYLIEACGKLRDRSVDFKCLLIGDGEKRPELENQVESLGLTDRVEFLGSRNRSDIAELLRTCHAAVVPSVPLSNGVREGIPVVLMEAMATGLPVVASGISGIPELVTHEVNGILTEPRNSDEIADALIRLAESADMRERLGEAGRRRIMEDFDVHRNACAIQDMFRLSAQHDS